MTIETRESGNESVQDTAGRPDVDATDTGTSEGAALGAINAADPGDDAGAGDPAACGCGGEASAAEGRAAALTAGAAGVRPRRGLVSPALKSEILEYLQALAIAVVLAAFIITFVAQSFVVEGSSMEPNLHDRQRLLVNKIVYRFREPKRGEVIVFRYPANPRRKFIKRVIGVPGDVVEVRDGHVVLNGIAYEEDYVQDLTFGSFGPKEVPEGHYWVLGDNRNNSDDSRYPDVGFVPRRNIIGKAFVSWWPPGEVGLVSAREARPIEP